MYSILLKTEFIISIPIFILLLFISAPYGKFVKTGWGPAIKAPTAWLLMELPAVVLPLLFFIRSAVTASPLQIAFIITWELHYLQRTFVYPRIMNKDSHRMPTLIILFSAVFNLMNGYLNGYGIFILADFGTPELLSVRFLLGITVFAAGFIINLSSDRILRNLRKPGETGYKIPQQGLFRYVCSPHYLGEIMEWTGWAVMTWSPAGAAFMVFTIANLAPRAVSNLKWYRSAFPNFPEDRKALIPFIL